MPYVTQSPDTSEAVERLQFEMLRRMGRKARFEAGLALIDESVEMMWHALERTHPDWTADQLQVEWVRVQFGEELAAHCAHYLRCKKRPMIAESVSAETASAVR